MNMTNFWIRFECANLGKKNIIHQNIYICFLLLRWRCYFIMLLKNFRVLITYVESRKKPSKIAEDNTKLCVHYKLDQKIVLSLVDFCLVCWWCELKLELQETFRQFIQRHKQANDRCFKYAIKQVASYQFHSRKPLNEIIMHD